MRRLLVRVIPLLLTLVVLLTLSRPAPAFAAAPQQAVFAGGCFWCLEHDLQTRAGVLDVVSGYSGGRLANPTYRQVSSGGTGHQEVVQVRFDPERISYSELLRAYWRNIDPFDGGGQFCDRGRSYRPVIFTANAGQLQQARASAAAAAQELQQPATSLAVAIRPLERFWPAEAYHQNYAEHNPVQYNYYRWACGRDRRLTAVWGKRAGQGAPWSGVADNQKLRKS